MTTMTEKNNLAQTYLDVAGVMFVAIDRQGTVTLVNKKGCELRAWNYNSAFDTTFKSINEYEFMEKIGSFYDALDYANKYNI